MPFSLHLIEFHHDKYPGTDIPKNFPAGPVAESRQWREPRVLIYMNNPLRYQARRFIRPATIRTTAASILQVVHNPSWLTPYFRA